VSTLGIDLGTSNSAAAYLMSGGQVRVVESSAGQVLYAKAFPSCVQYDAQGQVIVAGVTAWYNLGSERTHIIRYVKRIIGKSYAEVMEDLEKLGRLRQEGSGSGSLAFLEELSDRFAEERGSGALLLRVGEEEYKKPVEVYADLLRCIRKEAEAYSHDTFDAAVIAKPAYFDANQVEATKNAAELVFGKEEGRVTVISEPLAAALGVGAGKERPELVVVFDLGGGTLDVVIGRLDDTGAKPDFVVLQERGDALLGGIDIDDLILEEVLAADHKLSELYPSFVGDQRNLRVRLRKLVEQQKVDLSRELESRLRFAVRGHGIEFSLTRERLERLLRSQRRDLVGKEHPSFLTRCESVLRQALTEAGLLPNDIGKVDRLIMVGGPTRMPAVRAMLREVFKGNAAVMKSLDEKEARYREDPTWDDPEPMELVARGAASYMNGYGGSTLVPHNYGTWFHDSGFKVMLPEGTVFQVPFPGRVESRPADVRSNSPHPTIPLMCEKLEGGEKKCTCVGLLTFFFVPDPQQSELPWQVCVSYIRDGTLKVQGTQPGLQPQEFRNRREASLLTWAREFISPYVDAEMLGELWEHGRTRQIAIQLLRKQYEHETECQEAVRRVASFLEQREEELLGKTEDEALLLFLRELFPQRSQSDLRQVRVSVVREIDRFAASVILGRDMSGLTDGQIVQLLSQREAEIHDLEALNQTSSEEANRLIRELQRVFVQSLGYAGPQGLQDVCQKLAHGLSPEERDVLVEIIRWWPSL